MQSVREKTRAPRRNLPALRPVERTASANLAPFAAPATPDAPTEAIDLADTLDDAVLHTQVSWGLGILAGIIVAAFVMAGVLLGRGMLGLGTVLFTLYLVLFGIPFWIAAIYTEGGERREALLREVTGTAK